MQRGIQRPQLLRFLVVSLKGTVRLNIFIQTRQIMILFIYLSIYFRLNCPLRHIVMRCVRVLEDTLASKGQC